MSESATPRGRGSTGSRRPEGRRGVLRAVPRRARPETGRGFVSPLDAFYARAGIPAPEVRVIPASRVPTAYRSLLVHDRDMTPTLEAHFGGPVALRTLSTLHEGGSYCRRVLLVRRSSGRPVVMAAVRLDIAAFSTPVRRRILGNRVPLGRVLRDGGVDYRSRPTAFLAVRPNPEMLGVFWMKAPRTLYGRQTEITLKNRSVGEIVEILPHA